MRWFVAWLSSCLVVWFCVECTHNKGIFRHPWPHYFLSVQATQEHQLPPSMMTIWRVSEYQKVGSPELRAGSNRAGAYCLDSVGHKSFTEAAFILFQLTSVYFSTYFPQIRLSGKFHPHCQSLAALTDPIPDLEISKKKATWHRTFPSSFPSTAHRVDPLYNVEWCGIVTWWIDCL